MCSGASRTVRALMAVFARLETTPSRHLAGHASSGIPQTRLLYVLLRHKVDIPGMIA